MRLIANAKRDQPIATRPSWLSQRERQRGVSLRWRDSSATVGVESKRRGEAS